MWKLNIERRRIVVAEGRGDLTDAEWALSARYRLRSAVATLDAECPRGA